MPSNNTADLPENGGLQVSVYGGSIGKPVDNARITITKSGDEKDIIEELISDSSGQADVVELPAPPLEYSLNVNEPKPYGEYDVKIYAADFEPVTVRGVQILPDCRALQDIILNPLDNYGQENTIAVRPHTLWGTYPPKIAEDDVKELPPSKNFVVLPEPVIPEYVIVHTGAPTNSAAKNYRVNYKDYIKNVASTEIYATWPYETLKANILAIMSFALNRIYTEWYRGKGYQFTITNSTAFDQAFTYGRNIFGEISAVVDEIFTNFITKPNIRQPLFAQYCDGKRIQCPNWLSQWGSKTLGDRGYSYTDILKRYYGSDTYVMSAKSVEGVPASYPGYALQRGSSGAPVRRVQEQLNAVSKNYPAIPKVAVDGVFGEGTRAAVQKFQSIFKLSSDGVVGPATWYKLSDVYVAVTKMAEGLPR